MESLIESWNGYSATEYSSDVIVAETGEGIDADLIEFYYIVKLEGERTWNVYRTYTAAGDTVELIGFGVTLGLAQDAAERHAEVFVANWKKGFWT